MIDQISVWKAEHTNFRRLLDLLDVQVLRFHEGARPDYDLMLDIIYYLIHYPDRFHHPKEDAAVERLLQKAPESHALAAQLKHEHKVIADSGALLLSQLEGVLAGALIKRAAVEAPAATYAFYYRQHMAQEEVNLFPLIQRSLDSKDWAGVDEAIPVQIDPLFGGHPEKRYVHLHQRIISAGEAIKS